MDEQQLALNEKQEKAVNHEGGPLLIVAGPGTGKTRTITEKIRHLISEKDVDPQSVLALTFTEKAAEEMLHRVDAVMPLGYEEPWLSTFHSFCDRILRESGMEIGLDPDFEIMTGTEQWLFLREHIFELGLDYYLPLGNPSKFISALLNLFSRAQDENVSVNEFKEFVATRHSELDSESDEGFRQTLKQVQGDDPSLRNAERGQRNVDGGPPAGGAGAAEKEEIEKLQELAGAYKKYQELKIQESKMDFGDLIFWTIKLFRERSSVLKNYRDQFEYILVDEFQDTNYAQYQLTKLLAPAEENPNLMVVGDDLQAVYKFRGASLSNILKFKEDYPDAESIVLNKDYRNPQPIIDAATTLGRKNEPNTLEARIGIDKGMEAVRSAAGNKPGLKGTNPGLGECGGTPIQIIAAKTLEEEAERVVQKVIELSKEEGYNWRDFAVLARANNHLDPFVASFKRNGVPYQLLGNRGLFDQPEIRELIAFLRVLCDPKNSSALFELLTSSAFNIDSRVISDLLTQSRKKRASLWDLIKQCVDNPEVLKEWDLSYSWSDTDKKGIRKVMHLVETAQQCMGNDLPSQILYDFVMDSGFVERFLGEDSVENRLRIKNLNLFFEKIKNFEADVGKRPFAGKASVPNFVEYLDLLMEAGENPAQAEIEDIDTVNLLTVHSAKGLEFPVVFIVNLVSGRFPTRRRSRTLELPDELVKDILLEGDHHLQEERRLFYVGCTRASDKLFLCWGKDYGGKRERTPSGFIEELGISPSTKLRADPQPTADSAQQEKEQLPFLRSEKMINNKCQIIPVGFRPEYISHSQVDIFNQCPLKYKYRYVLGIPTPAHHALSFGQTIHRTLRDFHRADLFGSKDLEYLLELYEEHWIEEGYESAEHKEKRFEEGKRILKDYYKSHQEKLAKPLHLEKKFTLKISGIPLVGSIDRIDEIEEGIEIIDYKTGKVKEQKKVDRDDQLTIYALAARDALGLDPKCLALYFMQENKKVTTTRTAEDLEEKREELEETVEKIKKSKFEANPGFLCKWCDYKHLCEEYKVGD